MYRSLLNAKKIKYNIMNDIFLDKLDGVQEINCFIPLDSILKGFYSMKPDEVAESLSVASPNALSSEIINVIAHYRHYFWSRYGLPSTYWIYYSFDMAEYCCCINTEYKNDYYAKRNGLSDIKEYKIINENIARNLKLIKIITEYLPNIYFIDTGSVEPSCFPQILINKNKSKEYVKNIIFTSNKVDYQLVNNPYTLIISLASDNSKLYDSNNIIQRTVKEIKSKDDRKHIIQHVKSILYVPMLAITGYKSYNLKGVKGWGNVKTLKKFSKLIEENKIINTEYATLDDILTEMKINDIELINNNYKILNFNTIAKNISNKEYINLKKQINNKSDNMSLLEINNKYYEKNPLMLIELMEGEE